MNSNGIISGLLLSLAHDEIQELVLSLDGGTTWQRAVLQSVDEPLSQMNIISMVTDYTCTHCCKVTRKRIKIIYGDLGESTGGGSEFLDSISLKVLPGTAPSTCLKSKESVPNGNSSNGTKD